MPGSRWSRRLADGATEHLGYKAVAFALAVALWVAASGEEPAIHYVRVSFVPTLDSGVTLVGTPPTVRALVEGPASEILKLYATPPALHRTLSRASLDPAQLELHASEVELPAGVTRVRVRDVQPHALTLRLRGARVARAVPNDTFALTPVPPGAPGAPATPAMAPAVETTHAVRP